MHGIFRWEEIGGNGTTKAKGISEKSEKDEMK